MSQNASHYDVLGVSRAAGPRRIEKAYRRKVRSVHPDVNKAADALDQFYRVQCAYETLIDPQQRLDYDHQMAVQRGLVDEPTVQPAEPRPAAFGRGDRIETPEDLMNPPGRHARKMQVETPVDPAPRARTIRTYGYGRPVVYMPSYRRHSKRRHERQRRRIERRNRMMQYGFAAACVIAGVISLYQLSQIASFTSPVEAAFYEEQKPQPQSQSLAAPEAPVDRDGNSMTDESGKPLMFR